MTLVIRLKETEKTLKKKCLNSFYSFSENRERKEGDLKVFGFFLEIYISPISKDTIIHWISFGSTLFFSNIVIIIIMSSQRGGGNGERKEETVVVAIDKDKGSQYALKWAVDNLLGKGKHVTLLHVNQRPSSGPPPGMLQFFS